MRPNQTITAGEVAESLHPAIRAGSLLHEAILKRDFDLSEKHCQQLMLILDQLETRFGAVTPASLFE